MDLPPVSVLLPSLPPSSPAPQEWRDAVLLELYCKRFTTGAGHLAGTLAALAQLASLEHGRLCGAVAASEVGSSFTSLADAREVTHRRVAVHPPHLVQVRRCAA